MVNVPNAVTIVRTVAAIILAVLAIAGASVALAAAAYLCYWVGDVLDGVSARLLGQETRAGAVLDIIADRACCSLCAAALLVLRPEMALPVGIFMTQFLVIDCLLSLSFLYWPVLSPNYFDLVHRGSTGGTGGRRRRRSTPAGWWCWCSSRHPRCGRRCSRSLSRWSSWARW